MEIVRRIQSTGQRNPEGTCDRRTDNRSPDWTQGKSDKSEELECSREAALFLPEISDEEEKIGASMNGSIADEIPTMTGVVSTVIG